MTTLVSDFPEKPFTKKVSEDTILDELGGGLTLRRATEDDTESLAAFNTAIHNDAGVGVTVRDLMSGVRPGFSPGDFTLVEDADGKIVSSLCLVPQVWTYDGIRFDVGQPEFVGTLPEYRRRGLVRAQFDVIHRWSAERGHLLQTIVGIPWYYRQFGYEFALEFAGGREGSRDRVPQRNEGEEEPFQFRPAGGEDLPFLSAIHEAAMQRYAVACQWDSALWRYKLIDQSPRGCTYQALQVIETGEGRPVGSLAYGPKLDKGKLHVSMVEIDSTVAYRHIAPSILRFLLSAGELLAADGTGGEPDCESGKTCTALVFDLGTEHPLYAVNESRLPVRNDPYCHYIRIPDLPVFLRRITPALEKRLDAPETAGYSGEMKISFYRDGLRMAFEEGRITAVERWAPSPEEWGNAAFPDRTFLQLLMGYRSLAELRHAFPDCWVGGDELNCLLSVLFPKKTSRIWGIV